ncbi:MAG: metal ABC transporter permease [Pirellulales bacterium]|nr:metal ABC transporter permease [Pirellulales bacterium]
MNVPEAMLALSLSTKVTVGTAALGGIAGAIGALAVLRGRSLLGDMLSHAALPGVVLAFLLTGSRSLAVLSVGALASGLAAVGLMTLVIRWTRTKEDAAIGVMLSTFFGLGVVLLSKATRSTASGNSAGLTSFLFGEPGNMLTSDLALIGAVGIASAATLALLFKEFKLVAFDPDFALSQGWPATRLDLAMMTLVAAVTIAGLPIVGVVLMAAMIILPAATARMWTHRLHTLLLLAGALGVVAGGVGPRLGHGVPAGPAIVLTAAALFVLSLLFAPEQGMIARLVHEQRLRRRVAQDHLLRSLYELAEPRLAETPMIPFAALAANRGWRPARLRRLLSANQEQGLLAYRGDTVTLTPLGIRAAAEATRRHRLWELYMMRVAGAAADHVDRSADDVEHLLPPAVLLELEAQLAAETAAEAAAAPTVPPSPHRMGGDAP